VHQEKGGPPLVKVQKKKGALNKGEEAGREPGEGKAGPGKERWEKGISPSFEREVEGKESLLKSDQNKGVRKGFKKKREKPT